MERTIKKTLVLALTTLLVAGFLAVPASAGDDDNTTGEVSLRVLGFAERDPNDSAKFEQLRDVPTGLVLDHVLFSWWGDDGGFVDLDITDAVENDQRISFAAGRFDLFQASIDWVETPFRWSDYGMQLHAYQGIDHGTAYFSLPDGLQEAMEAASGNDARRATLSNAVEEGAHAVPTWSHRETGTADFRFFPSRNSIVGFEVSRERRDGWKYQNLPTYFGDGIGEVALPIDYVTDWLTVYAEINRRHWRLGGHVQWSDFDSAVDQVMWDQQRYADESPAGQMLMVGVTDNEMWKWALDGGFRLDGNTTINWTISQGETESNDPLLPHTLNPTLLPDYSPLPTDRYRGQYDTNLYELRIASHPIDWFGVNAWWRRYEYEKHGDHIVFWYNPLDPPEDSMGYVAADSAHEPARATLHQGYRKTNTGLALSFTPADWVDIGVSYENIDMDRDDSAVDNTDEDVVKLTLDFDVNDHVFIRAKYSWSDRDAGHYDPHWLEHHGFPAGEGLDSAPFNEAAREFYLADRDRDEWSFLGEFTINSQFSIFAEAIWTRNEYDDPNTGYSLGSDIMEELDRLAVPVGPEEWDLLLAGREKDETEAYTLGFSASSPNHRVNFSIDHTWEDVEWQMASRYRGRNSSGGVLGGGWFADDPLDNWYTYVDDEYRTLHMTFDAELDDAAMWRLIADLTWTKAEGSWTTIDVPGGSASGDMDALGFPKVESEWTFFTLTVRRKLSENWDLGMEYWYEKWEDVDWASDSMMTYMGYNDVDPSNSVNALYLGRDYSDYENHIISLLATYRF